MIEKIKVFLKERKYDMQLRKTQKNLKQAESLLLTAEELSHQFTELRQKLSVRMQTAMSDEAINELKEINERISSNIQNIELLKHEIMQNKEELARLVEQMTLIRFTMRRLRATKKKVESLVRMKQSSYAGGRSC